jgi:hypothetical protein
MRYSMSPMRPRMAGVGAYSDANVFSLDGHDYVVFDDGTVMDDAGNIVQGASTTLRQIESAAPGAVASAKSSSGFNFDALMTNLSSIVSTVVQAEAQRDLLKANLDRAAKGLPPLNAQNYMPGVNVGVSSDTKPLIYAGLGVLALVGLSGMFGGRRSRRR